MKKLLLIILLVALLFPTIGTNGTYVFAEEIDFTSMNLEDLAALQQNVELEMSVRSASLLYQGTYIVGKDISEGDHILTGISSVNGFFVYRFIRG